MALVLRCNSEVRRQSEINNAKQFLYPSSRFYVLIFALDRKGHLRKMFSILKIPEFISFIFLSLEKKRFCLTENTAIGILLKLF